MVDQNNLREMFKRHTGYEPNIQDPRTFNEKVQWRKFYDQDSKYVDMVDKIKSKEVAKALCPDVEVLPVLWKGTKLFELPLEKGTIVKVSSSSGGGWKINRNYIGREQEELLKTIKGKLDFVYGVNKGEWAYSRVRNQVFVEPLIGEDFLDVKYFVFDGVVKGIGIRGNDRKVKTWTYYDRDYKRIDVRFEGRENPDLDWGMSDVDKGVGRRIAEMLGVGCDFVRVDLYFKKRSKGFIFGEFTLYPFSGMAKIEPVSFDAELGKFWKRQRWDSISKRMVKDRPIVGVEVGVWQGTCSEKLLELMPNLKLYMVDRWKEYSDEDKKKDPISTKTKTVRDQAVFDDAKRKALKKVEKFGKRAVVVESDSVLASMGFEDGTLDFVFLDGDHSEEGVREDIKVWLSKVKRGGYLCGHDFTEDGKRPGITKVVKEFFGKSYEIDMNSMWFYKVEE